MSIDAPITESGALAREPGQGLLYPGQAMPLEGISPVHPTPQRKDQSESRGRSSPNSPASPNSPTFARRQMSCRRIFRASDTPSGRGVGEISSPITVAYQRLLRHNRVTVNWRGLSRPPAMGRDPCDGGFARAKPHEFSLVLCFRTSWSLG